MSNCVSCGEYMPEGAGMVCRACEERSRATTAWVPATVISDKKVEQRRVLITRNRSRAGESFLINTGDLVIEINGDDIKRLLEAKFEGVR